MNLRLGIADFRYRDLHDPARLQDLSRAFDDELRQRDPELFTEFDAYRACRGEGWTPERVSQVLVKTAPGVADFVARLFQVTREHDAHKARAADELDTVFRYRQSVVARLGKRFKPDEVANWHIGALTEKFNVLQKAALPSARRELDAELKLARVAVEIVDIHEALASTQSPNVNAAQSRLAEIRCALEADADARNALAEELRASEPAELSAALLDVVQRWTFAALHDASLHATVKQWISFKQPAKVDFTRLVHFQPRLEGTVEHLGLPEQQLRRRDGFGLTDTRFGAREVMFEVDHCIYCHDRDRDSCSKGMRRKDGVLRDNPLGVTLTGCPLEEKISEAHLMKRGGDNIAALALITVDNPMVPGTGHRICNDCMKACIYQKVEPVNIPQVETNVLTDVLFMPFGFEIYSLLTRWNPLNVHRPHALPHNGRNVLIVGLGPAGYTLAHYLLNEGFGVTGIDGLKIEPLPRELTGDRENGPEPIKDFQPLYEELDKRIMAGFGGVAEYGITVRWDKNFLKVIHLTLARRRAFTAYGGIRFGGTLTIDDAWDLGFDHIAIATGAGKPTVIGLENNMLRGVRKASDFLMALQLTGAAKRSSMANLQVRLPAGVIGGGLTGVDTATELVAYYPVQVEKALERYEILSARHGEETVLARYDAEERAILGEFLEHGRTVRAEREQARAEGRAPDLLSLVNRWGGVTLYYRKGLEDSPAYRQNHEEVHKALEEGINFAPGMNPVEALPDEHGHLAAVRFQRHVREGGRWVPSGDEPIVPLGSLMVAAGTSPNTIYETEHPNTFELDGRFFQHFEPQWNGSIPTLERVDDAGPPKIARPAPFTSYGKDGRFITFFGDNHPVYAGNVVKAMASAKDGYPYIVRLFEQALAGLEPGGQAARDAALDRFQRRLDREFIATVREVRRLTPTIVEVVAHAPMQARQFHPGQFYRIQNLESGAPVIENTSLAAEGLALTGAWVDKINGLISLITLEMGTSSKLCALWQPGQEIVVMGPTGTPTEIPRFKTVLLVGGGLGNAVLFSIGKAMREAGSRVIYFAGYRAAGDVFKVDEIEAAADVIVWAVDPGPEVAQVPTTRAQDMSFVGNIVDAMVAYAEGDLGVVPIPLSDAEHMIVIGSDRMMAAVKAARFDRLKPYLNPRHTAIGSINSSMQCMLKGVCAQCLCKHVDPETGEPSFVYSCFNQDQPLDRVDFPNLHERLRQNSVQEKLANLWLDYLLDEYENLLMWG